MIKKLNKLTGHVENLEGNVANIWGDVSKHLRGCVSSELSIDMQQAIEFLRKLPLSEREKVIDAVCAQKKDAACNELLSTYFSVADKLKEEFEKRDENKETL